MIKKITAVLLFLCIIFCGTAFAGLQGQRPYKPSSQKQYSQLKDIYPDISDGEIAKSVKISQNPANTELINNILVFLNYKKLVKQIKKLPPILWVYCENNRLLGFRGGAYYDNKNIIILNANLLMAYSEQRNKIPKYAQDAIDFIAFSSILSHELMHYEDFLEVGSINNMDAFSLSEWKAYKRSEKTLEYFLKMSEAEANELIPIENFYKSVQVLEDYFTDMRKNYIKIVDAADIFLNNEDKICKTFGMDKNMFKILPFYPQIQFNAKNGGHIIRIDAPLLDFAQTLKFSVNILTGNIDILNPPQEIEAVKRQAKNVTIIDKNSYSILR